MRAGGENQTSGKLARRGLWAFQRPRPCRPLQYNVILLTFLRPDRTLGPMTGEDEARALVAARELERRPGPGLCPTPG